MSTAGRRRVAVAGASGRMGRMLIEAVAASPDLVLSAALDLAGCAAIGSDAKGLTSTVLYALAIPLSFVACWIALGIYVLVALMWLVPDRRIESRLRAR